MLAQWTAANLMVSQTFWDLYKYVTAYRNCLQYYSTPKKILQKTETFAFFFKENWNVHFILEKLKYNCIFWIKKKKKWFESINASWKKNFKGKIKTWRPLNVTKIIIKNSNLTNIQLILKNRITVLWRAVPTMTQWLQVHPRV